MEKYEEMARRVLARRDAYVLRRRRRRRQTVSVLGGLCLVLLLGAVLWPKAPADLGPVLDGAVPIQNREPSPDRADAGETLAPEGAGDLTQTLNGEDGTTTAKEQTSAPTQIIRRSAQADAREERTARPQTQAAAELEQSRQGESASQAVGSSGVHTWAEEAPAQENAVGLGEMVYQAVWGGSYTDPSGYVVVYLTENTPENQTKVFQRNPTLQEDQVQFRSAQYTLAYLTKLQDQISQGMMDGSLSFVTTSSLLEAENCIQVTVTSQAEENLAKVRALDTQGGAIRFVFAAGDAQSLE